MFVIITEKNIHWLLLTEINWRLIPIKREFSALYIMGSKIPCNKLDPEFQGNKERGSKINQKKGLVIFAQVPMLY